MGMSRLILVILAITEVTIVLNETLKNPWLINADYNPNVRFGDLLVSPRQLRKYTNTGELPKFVSRKDIYDIRWRNNIIPFQLSDQYNRQQRAIIVEALLELQRRSCFKFVERIAQIDYISIEPLDGCYSYVGRIGGRQLMSLARDCLVNYIIWHEMMHALGFEHEHQRPDRDAYIRVVYSNVIPGQIMNFDKLESDEVEIYGDVYDYFSIMHYDGTAFGRYDRKAKKRLATMIPLKRGIELRDNVEFTRFDIEKLNRLGKCAAYADEPTKGSSCVDVDANCSELVNQGLCEHHFYKDLMREACNASCGFCMKNEEDMLHGDVEMPKNCFDSDPSCAIYAHHGFCTVPFYAMVLQKDVSNVLMLFEGRHSASEVQLLGSKLTMQQKNNCD